jgi:hypothetical protein
MVETVTGSILRNRGGVETFPPKNPNLMWRWCNPTNRPFGAFAIGRLFPLANPAKLRNMPACICDMFLSFVSGWELRRRR